MTEKEIFDRIVTIIQERQGEDFVVTESLSLKDDFDIKFIFQCQDKLHQVN